MHICQGRFGDVPRAPIDGASLRLPRGPPGGPARDPVLRPMPGAERAAHDPVLASRETATARSDDDPCARRRHGDGPHDARAEHPAAGARRSDPDRAGRIRPPQQGAALDQARREAARSRVESLGRGASSVRLRFRRRPRGRPARAAARGNDHAVRPGRRGGPRSGILTKRNATAAVIGAGDFIGSAIAKKFAAEGFTIFAGRRNADKLAPLVADIEAAGGAIVARGLDARKEDDIAGFLRAADGHAPLEVCIFNVGANVNFALLETTERVFRKVWEMACYSGFLAGREAARLMLPRGKGCIFFTGATASVRGGVGYAAFASAKFGLRAVAQSMARELGPNNIHVAHLIIDSGVDTAWVRERREQMWGKEALDNPDLLMPPASVAASYWQLYQQPRSAWTFELEIRPF